LPAKPNRDFEAEDSTVVSSDKNALRTKILDIARETLLSQLFPVACGVFWSIGLNREPKMEESRLSVLARLARCLNRSGEIQEGADRLFNPCVIRRVERGGGPTACRTVSYQTK
jgi:hypothetical protein